jgi:hypothetical protein
LGGNRCRRHRLAGTVSAAPPGVPRRRATRHPGEGGARGEAAGSAAPRSWEAGEQCRSEGSANRTGSVLGLDRIRRWIWDREEVGLPEEAKELRVLVLKMVFRGGVFAAAACGCSGGVDKFEKNWSGLHLHQM